MHIRKAIIFIREMGVIILYLADGNHNTLWPIWSLSIIISTKSLYIGHDVKVARNEKKESFTVFVFK